MKRDINAIKEHLNKKIKKRKSSFKFKDSNQSKGCRVKKVRTIKNKKKLTKNFQQIKLPNSTEVVATDDDFSNPIRFFESLWNPYKESTGVIKVTPPDNWKNVNEHIFKTYFYPNFLNSSKKLETRTQNLNGLLCGEKFKFAKKYNFKDYLEYSHFLENKFYPNSGNIVETNEKESDFWRFCKEKNTHSTSYAADITYSTFFNDKLLQEISVFLKTNNQWNLSSLFLQENSLFQFLHKENYNHISGLTIPWIYFGMLFSTFCWHVEDLYMYSLNYMYTGSSKIWYSISHKEKEKLDKFIRKKKLKLKLEDPNILHKLILLIEPRELVKNNIKVFKTIQKPGELILTLPKAYHAGFSLGFNCAEAVNIATTNWIPYGMKAIEDYSKNLSKTPVFPMEWLITKNYENLDSNIFTKSQSKNNDSHNQIKKLYATFIARDKLKRKKIETFLNSKNITYRLEKLSKKINYAKTECRYCTNYGFLSYIKCELCKVVICIDHANDDLCTCVNPIITLFYRKYN